MCHVLKLNRSSFYKWVNIREKRRLKMCSDALIAAQIKTIFDDEHGLYGAKRIAASLKADTDFGPINHKKVARIIKIHGALKALVNDVGASLLGAILATASCQI
ncbi:IS3 family transposase [Corynebacterium macginleyi]|uniref:IS3 family transposase n=1 Tax=Corynebacterium macginleyi TaxID=38290 RepID=UPI0019096467|nr:IS3 family transposase [Corynebacterium macginleyi]MBK4160255.1 IS3 family transposase [Corynebacterium macginleyi]